MSYDTRPDLFVGVDPGKKGGLALVDDAGRLRSVRAMPLTAEGHVDSVAVADWFLTQTNSYCDVFLACEKVWAHPGQGVCSMFTFGRQVGQVLGALEATLGGRAVEVAALTWQRDLLGNVAAGDSKKAAEAFALAQWPDRKWLATPRSRKPHEGIIDASCVAEYARRHWKEMTS
jgi:hypothetical protein